MSWETIFNNIEWTSNFSGDSTYPKSFNILRKYAYTLPGTSNPLQLRLRISIYTRDSLPKWVAISLHDIEGKALDFIHKDLTYDEGGFASAEDLAYRVLNDLYETIAGIDLLIGSNFTKTIGGLEDTIKSSPKTFSLTSIPLMDLLSKR